MKKIIAAVVAFLLIMIPVATIAGYQAKKDVAKHVAKVTTTEFTRKPEYTTVVETTVAETTTEESTTATTEAETTRREEYNLYQEMSIKTNSLPISFSAPVKAASFGYVPYKARTEGEFYFYTALRVEVDSSSEDLEIYFQGSEYVFPGNMPEAVVNANTQKHTWANYELDTSENSATMNGFEAGLSSVEITFPSYMSTVNLPIGDEIYEVTCLQIVFTN